MLAQWLFCDKYPANLICSLLFCKSEKILLMILSLLWRERTVVFWKPERVLQELFRIIVANSSHVYFSISFKFIISIKYSSRKPSMCPSFSFIALPYFEIEMILPVFLMKRLGTEEADGKVSSYLAGRLQHWSRYHLHVYGNRESVRIKRSKRTHR